MAGRQSHGRPLLSSKPAAKTFRKSKSKAQAKALDAFTIASEQYPTKEKKTPRFREIEAPPPDAGKKHSRAGDDEDEDEDEDDDDDEQPRRKRAKPSSGGGDGDDSEYGSDSEGNEWHYGVNEDEDSELDSDEAFGESDQEDFQGYSFGGKKAAKGKKDDSDDEEEDEDSDDSLGEDAIDLAQALDEYESDESMADQEEGSEESDSEDEASSPPSSDDEDEDEQEADPSKLGELQKFIAGFGGEGDEDAAPTKQKQKLSLKDLGLSGVKDAQMRKSVKLMAKEEKETRPGAGKKLEVPLSRRQQDKLQRAAAYDKANETLGRWQETVKHNRRAEHLMFPLPQNAADEGLDNRELQAITAKNSTSELEQTILNIMQQSGLALNKQEENKMKKAEEEEGMSKEALKDLVNQRRRERELNSREEKRAKRIKKIKSKAYHRVHRKEKEREDKKLHEAMAENGEIDSEAERDAQDRARALERVGARHRDSKWAKLGASNKRAVWDDDYRAGLHDMARREDELRKRKEGRAGNSDEEASEDDSDGSEEGGEERALLRQLKRLEQEEDDGPASGLMKMKFMQKAEAAQKKANDELIAQIRRDLDSGAEDGDSEEEATEVGRKKYGSAAAPAIAPPALSRKQKKSASAATDEADDGPDNSVVNTGYSITAEASKTGSAWSSGPRKKSSKSSAAAGGPRVADLDNTQAMTASAPKPKSRSSAKSSSSSAAAPGGTGADEDVDSDSGADIHLPLAIRDIAQMDKAFAGDDVVVDFAREKADIEAEDDDKIVDNTLPGWGGWVGDGVSSREKKRQQGRFVTKVEGIKKADRKDAKLDKVIISEKRVKKNDKYLASQLPHPFESRAQYERSLRLPLGPEWVTKESFQEATKPRILKKQGIIAPMSRPTL
ncbi:hypothetical protein EsH8_II_001355 [Colletotrichum jinshuiense]